MRLIICLLALIIFYSCTHGPQKPDTSKIKVKLTTIRFEKELFKLDTNQLDTELPLFMKQHPEFVDNFIYDVLNADPSWDNKTLCNYVGSFIRGYDSIYHVSEKTFDNFSSYEKEVEEGMKLIKYYFPKFPLPDTLITYLGPLDGYGDGWSGKALLVGLHHHLGADFSRYQDPYFVQTYPKYLSDQFEPATISVNCMKRLIEVIYPIEGLTDEKLLIQMVKNGKRLYLLSRLLPEKPEHLLIGYSEQQMKDCYSHEKAIWSLFTENNYLQSIDFNVVKNYVSEGPKTQELGEGAPGNIGSFAGWQIVKKFMDKHPEMSLEKMMQENEEVIFSKARYKP